MCLPEFLSNLSLPSHTYVDTVIFRDWNRKNGELCYECGVNAHIISIYVHTYEHRYCTATDLLHFDSTFFVAGQILHFRMYAYFSK